MFSAFSAESVAVVVAPVNGAIETPLVALHSIVGLATVVVIEIGSEAVAVPVLTIAVAEELPLIEVVWLKNAALIESGREIELDSPSYDALEVIV